MTKLQRIVIAAFLLAAASCSGDSAEGPLISAESPSAASDAAESITGLAGEVDPELTPTAISLPEPERREPFAELLPTSLVDDLRLLNQAIDLRLQRAAFDCMTERGWPWPKPSIEPPSFVSANTIDVLARTLGIDDAVPPSAIDIELQELSESALAQYTTDERKCFVGSEWNIDSPIGAAGSYYDQAYTAASDRVQSNPDWLTSREAADDCLRAQGYESLGAAFNEIEQLTVELSQRYDAGGLSNDEAERELIVLRDSQDALDAVEESCFRSHQVLTGQIFDNYLAEELNDPRIEAEIIELQQVIGDYREIIDELRALDAAPS